MKDLCVYRTTDQIIPVSMELTGLMMVGLLSMKLVHSPIKEDFICMDKNSSTVAICLRQLSGQILAK